MVRRQSKAKELYDLAREAYDSGMTADAAELLRASALAHPHFKTLELLGETLVRLNQTREGAVFLAASAGFGTKQPRSRFLLAQVLASWGDAADARVVLLDALRINPQYKAAQQLLDQLGPAEEADSG